MAKIYVYMDYVPSVNSKVKVQSVGYISQRSKGVQKHSEDIDETNRVTLNQINAINQYIQLEDGVFTSLASYQKYLEDPTKENAYNFISEVKESLNIINEEVDSMAMKKNISIQYIQERLGVEKHEGLDHGLFDKNGIADAEYHKQVAADPNARMYRLVVSFRHEDAKEIGLTSLKDWMNKVQVFMPNVLREFKTEKDNLEWSAAYHAKQSQPHVHINIVCKDPNVFIDKESIRKVKREVAKEVFKEEIFMLNNDRLIKRTNYENELKIELESLTEEDYLKTFNSVSLCNQLYESLQDYHGKMVYKYLPKESKALVNQIYEELIKSPSVSNLLNQYAQSIADQMKIYKEVEYDGKVQIDIEEIKKDILKADTSKSRQTVVQNAILDYVVNNQNKLKLKALKNFDDHVNSLDKIIPKEQRLERMDKLVDYLKNHDESEYENVSHLNNDDLDKIEEYDESIGVMFEKVENEKVGNSSHFVTIPVTGDVHKENFQVPVEPVQVVDQNNQYYQKGLFTSLFKALIVSTRKNKDHAQTLRHKQRAEQELQRNKHDNRIINEYKIRR